MATEAQRLIGVSLTKIAKSRGRGGASLHKNLLVATVLQKARYVFMEDAYRTAKDNFSTSDTDFHKDTMELTESTHDDVTQPADYFIPSAPGCEVAERLRCSFEEETGPEQSECQMAGIKRCCEDISPSSKRRCISFDTCQGVGPCLCPIINFDSSPAVSLTLTFISPEQHSLSQLSLEPSHFNNLQSQRTILSV